MATVFETRLIGNLGKDAMSKYGRLIPIPINKKILIPIA